jgi:phenylpyruvate tautomerase PptA (4-oxalocrotonate tautomerase family)
MPWICVTTGPDLPDEAARALSRKVAAAAAAALDLVPDDVVVLVSPAGAVSAPGAMVSLAGRRRDEAAESALASAVRAEVAETLGLDPGLVAVSRL